MITVAAARRIVGAVPALARTLASAALLLGLLVVVVAGRPLKVGKAWREKRD